MAAYGQVRRAGMSGAPTGFDYTALQVLLNAYNCSGPVVFELIRAAESGLLSVLNEETE